MNIKKIDLDGFTKIVAEMKDETSIEVFWEEDEEYYGRFTITKTHGVWIIFHEFDSYHSIVCDNEYFEDDLQNPLREFDATRICDGTEWVYYEEV